MSANAGKFLTFLLRGEEYGIPINKVKEIMGIMDITFVPRMPDYVKGVINLRGKVIPVIDLRLRFEMEPIEYNNRTCIIFVEKISGAVKKQTGIIVDTVSEVIAINADNIEQPPDMGSKDEEGCINGMGKVKERVIMLLDIEKLLVENTVENL